jgi:hypothetical protein
MKNQVDFEIFEKLESFELQLFEKNFIIVEVEMVKIVK